MANKDNQLVPWQNNLTGRCIQGLDSAKIEFVAPDRKTVESDNFSELINMKYTDNGIAGVTKGMTKINSTALTSYPLIRSAFHFKKVQPAETHMLVQAYNSGETESKVFENTTAIPSAGDFTATELHTDASDAGKGRWSDAPDEHVAYCNSGETMTWGGAETRVSNFTVYDPNGTFIYDYTTEVQNTLSDAANVATLKQVSGIGSETMVLFHFEDTAPFQSDDPGNTHSGVANGGMDRSNVQKKFGSYSALFDGTDDYISMTDHADFDLSGGTWTYEGWVYINSLSSDVGLCAQAEEGWTQDYTNMFIDTLGAVQLKIHESTVAATGTVTLDTGASGSVDNVTVNSVEITDGLGVPFNSTLAQTASDLADNINGHTSSPNYTASATDETVTITSVRMGEDVNGFDVTSTCTTITSTDVDMANGASADVVDLSTPNSVVGISTWTHIRIVENANDYYIFVNGVQKAHIEDSSRTEGVQEYDSDVLIGAVYNGTATTKFFNGHIDELRLTNNALSTGNFDPPSSAYTTATANVNMRVGNTLPIDGLKFTISNANTSTGTLAVFYWASSGAWEAVTNLTDNTDVGGIPLAQSGTVTFDSTENIAKPTIIDGIFGFWFKVEITDADTATAISNVTVSEPFQDIQDFWDGEFRIAESVQLFEDSINKDNTINVLDDSFIFDTSTEGNTATYMQMDSLVSTTEYLQVGFSERQQGLRIKLIPDHVNTTANTVLTVYYWSGEDWVSVGDIEDGTIDNNISFAKSGFVTWNPVDRNTEFKKEINKESSVYYYKLEWSQNFTADVLAYYIAGIPVQRPIGRYKFPLHAQGRLWLFSDQAERKNQAIVSNLNELNTFNGVGVGDPLLFGDRTEIVGAVELFERTSARVESHMLIAKEHSMHVIEGNTPEDWAIVNLTDNIGCNAPETLRASPVGLEYAPLQRKQVAIWQGSSGIYMFDNTAIHPISDDLSNFFDQRNTRSINLDAAHLSYGFFSILDGEVYYHWCFASGSSTTLNEEWLLDVKRQKWFEVDRGTGKDLQGGTIAIDVNGNYFTYGFEDNGFLQKLNDGTTYDGNNIVYTFATGDSIPGGSINILSSVDSIRLATVSKTNTSNSILVYHYGDTKTAATQDLIANTAYYTLSTVKTGQRVAFPFKRINTPPHMTHKIKCVMTTNDEDVGFEPLYLGGFYKSRGLSERNITD